MVTALGVAVAPWFVGAEGASSSSPCPLGPRPLDVAADPAIAAVLAAATSPGEGSLLGASGTCVDVRVRAETPADVLAVLEGSAGDRPDVWVGDSSLWIDPAGPLGTSSVTSLARSPLVFAASPSVAERLTAPGGAVDLLSAAAAGEEMRLALPDPHRSAAAGAAVLAVQDAAAAHPDARHRLATVLRRAQRSAPEDPRALARLLDDGAAVAVPTTEQAVLAQSRSAGAVPAVASYPADGPVFDYPLVVLADGAAAKDADLLTRALTTPRWATLVQEAGFRAADGSAGAALSTEVARSLGLDGTRPAVSLPDRGAVGEAVRAFEAITSGTRMLAVLDVSGSMAAAVPEAGGRSTMDLAIAAAANGLGLYPDEASVGLWTFSTELTDTSDHHELAPSAPLGLGPDGVRGRERLAAALAGVAAKPGGGTALFDTVLAAVREVREGWQPGNVNSVVVMTDGQDDDPDGVPMDRLLELLGAEAGDRPVPVIGIALGAENDASALHEISRVTGGTTYEVQDVRRIHEVLADALAQRPCRPNC